MSRTISEKSIVLVGKVNMLPDPRKYHIVSLVKVFFFCMAGTLTVLLGFFGHGGRRAGGCVRCWDSLEVSGVLLWDEGATRAPGSA
jgi:hypothetical protein